MHERIASFAQVVCTCIVAWSCCPGARAADALRWQVVTADGVKIGHAWIRRDVIDGIVHETDQLEVKLGARDRRAGYRVRVETGSAADGSLRWLSREVRTPEGRSRIDARVVGEDLEVSHGRTGSREVHRLEGAARDLKSHEFARAWLADVGRGVPREPLRYRAWDPMKMAVVEVEWQPLAEDGLNVERRTRSPRMESVSKLRADAGGDIVLESLALNAFTLRRADATAAAAGAPDQVFDHIAPLLKESPHRIPVRELDAKIRYGFRSGGAQVGLPVGGGQRTWVEGGRTWIQVCASCPPDPVALTDEERRQALQSTAWLQAGDPQLRRRARSAIGKAPDASTKMRRLTRFVRSHLNIESQMLGYGTALDALKSRRGDCTEFAVLLAALGRAAGVPTRIAIGSVYARHFEGHRHVFVPHAWVQAWTGTGWESFDAALGSFDSTHLAFAVSFDGDPLTHFAGIALWREMSMESAARVVPRPAGTG